MTRFRYAPLVFVALGAALLSGCPGDPAAPDQTATDSPAVDAPTDEGGDAGGDALPDLFLAEAPADAKPLLEVKGAHAVGDEVVFEAKVGGRLDPFVAERAIFTVADAALPTCADNPDDGCTTPWDYCCETPEELLKQTATVRVVGADGKPLKIGLEGQRGLAGMTTVVVRGTVSEVNDAGVFVVDASGVYVQN